MLIISPIRCSVISGVPTRLSLRDLFSEPLNPGLGNLIGMKIKLKTHRCVVSIFRYLEPFRRDSVSVMTVTDRQTDGRKD